MPDYEIPHRAVSYTVVASGPVNSNLNYIEDALNAVDEKADKIDEKIDKTEKGAAGGVATLDGNQKIPTAQLPTDVYSQVFEVNTLSEQLALDANIGDVCKRNDLLRTYVLKAEPASINENWMEISAQGQVIPVETSGIEPYTAYFGVSDWETVSTNQYRLVYTVGEHNLSLYHQLFVMLKFTDGDVDRIVYPDYTTDEFGTISIYSDTTFDGVAIITDLYGNNDPLNSVAYCVNTAMMNSNGEEALFDNQLTSLEVNTTKPIVIVDGFNNRYVIEDASAITLPSNDGTYEIFIDSENINEDGVLTELTFIPVSNYLGVCRQLPSTGEDGQRCYVAYDHSYEYSNASWSLKAFTYVGRIILSNNSISALYTQPYNQNGVTTNYLSADKDYLFGKEINGLKINYISTTSISVDVGECLSSDRQRLMTLEQTITKDVFTAWGSGALVGTISGNWLHVFVIGDDFGNTDICVSCETTLDMSSLGNYTHYRRIGTLRLASASTLAPFENYNDKFYVNLVAYNGVFQGGNSTAITTTDYVPQIPGITAIYGVEFDTSSDATVQTGQFIYAYVSGRRGMFELDYSIQPNITVEVTTSGQLNVLGYIDNRELWT